MIPIANPARILIMEYSNKKTAKMKNIRNKFAARSKDAFSNWAGCTRARMIHSVIVEKIRTKSRKSEYENPLWRNIKFTKTKKISQSSPSSEF